MIKPKQTKSARQEHYVSVVDLENNPNTGRVFLVGYAYELHRSIEYHEFKTIKEWFDFCCLTILQNKKCKYLQRIYAHNGAGFDWTIIIPELYMSGYVDHLKTIQAAGRIIAIYITLKGIGNTNQKISLELCDSYALLPASLNDLLKSFNIDEKVPLEELPHIVNRYNPTKVSEYLKHDTLGLQQVIYQFSTLIQNTFGNIGKLPLTTPSLSFKLFKQFLAEPIYVSWNKKLCDFEAKAYGGGRVSCFETGKFPIKVYDVRSEYPYVMSQFDYPLGYFGAWTKHYQSDKLGIYTVIFHQPTDMIPLLYDPNVKEYVYDGQGTYCTPELEQLITIGGTFTVLEGYVYEKTGPLFREYVDKCYKLKEQAEQDGNTPLRTTMKLLLNSVYGKFAQKNESRSIVMLSPDEQKQKLENHEPFYDYGDFQVIVEPVDCDNRFLAIASFVTSYARVNIYKEMLKAQSKGNKVIYCDTDSLHLVGDGTDEHNQLGGLQYEYNGYGIYAGKKLYCLFSLDGKKAKFVHKGVSEKLTPGIHKLNRPQTFYRIVCGNTITIDQRTFPTMRETLLLHETGGKLKKRVRTLQRTA